MVSKAIRDGVITGNVDFSTRELTIHEKNDLYSTRDPQINFQKRIDYCTNLISTCNKAMLYQDVKAKETAEDDLEDEEMLLDELMDGMEDGFM